MPLPLTDLLLAKTVDETTSNWVPIDGGPKDLTFWLTSAGTTSGGNVTLEETEDPSSGATPSVLQTIAASTFTGTAKVAVHIRVGAGSYVRARISDAITGGGSVTVRVAGI